MKVVFITPSLSTGGRERVMSLLMNHLEERGIEVNLILYAKNRSVYFPLSSKIRIFEPDFEFAKSTALYSLKCLWFIRKTVKRLHPDVMVSFEETWNRFALLATLGLKVRKVISNRNNPYVNQDFIPRHLAKWLYPQADVLIAQTKVAKEVYINRYRLKKCLVIGNPITRLNVDFNRCRRENIIITVGRLMRTKNHDRLVRIFAKTRHEGWKLVIVGGDFANEHNSDRLKTIINELNLENDVEWVGNQKDVNSYLLRSKIFAFTSEKEGFPNVVGEAMAAQLPVVSYDCIAGPSEMITDGKDGYLIPLYNDELFIEKLNLLMANEQLRTTMGISAAASIKQFDAPAILDKFYSAIIETK